MGQGGEMGMERDFALDDGHTMQYAGDSLLSCILEMCGFFEPESPQ